MPFGSLDEWEKRLRHQVTEVDLLGEVSLSEEEVHLLGRLIGNLVNRQGWSGAARLLRERYPCAYAVFLVAVGAYHYEEGTFWQAVRDATGLPIPPTQTLHWGQLFEEIVQTLPVARFPPLGGHRYVGPILAHSGIPDYCLRDFFEHFLQPLLTRPEYAALSTEEFIRQRLLQSGISYTTDKPVLRFLEHGGPLAVDFVERCREMASRFTEQGEVPSPEEVGLPPRVVREYRAWLEGRPRPSLRQRTSFRSPALFLDPWGLGVGLRLPPQPTPNPDPQIRWRVLPGDPSEIPADFQKEGTEWETAPVAVFLPKPAPEYGVSLIRALPHGGEDLLQTWRVPGIAQDLPLLWFDPESGRRLPQRDVLPGGRLWVVRHQDVVLEADPPDGLRVLEQFPRLPGGWSDFVGEEVDLGQAQILRARWGGRSLEYAVFNEFRDQPSLEGNNRLPVEDGRPPLYVGAPPYLCVPLPSHDPRLHRWHVEVWNEGLALPPVHKSYTLADFQLGIQEGKAVLDLRAWLGDAPMGTYRVKVRGPLGRRADLAFRVLPALEMVGHETLYLPGEDKEAHLLVETDADTELTLQPGATDVEIVPQEEADRRRFYEVTAGIARADFPLRFLRRTPQGDSVSVPLSVPIRRLRWMMVLGPKQTPTLQWCTTSLRLPLEALEQAQEPLLLVDVFGGAVGNLRVVLSLRDEDGTPLQEQEGRWRAGQPYLRFDLTAFLDTLRQSSALQATFTLNLFGLPDRTEVSYPVLEVSRRFAVQWAGVESAQIGDTLYLRLRWEAPVQVRHRLARLWPLWRPWAPPLEIPIPDSARDEYRCALPAARLVPGKYLLEIVTRDPWATDASPPARPAANDPTVFPALIPPDAIAKRLGELQDQATSTGITFPVALETACIRRDAGQDALAQEALQWCFEHLDEANVEHILALVRTVAGDPDLDKPLRMKLAAAQRLQRILEDFQQGLLPEHLFREYLAQLPRPSLWSAEACEVLLAANDEPLRAQALQQLIERERPAGIQTLIRWLQEGRISDEDAAALIEKRLLWAVEGLKSALPHPAVVRLLETLERRYPGQVPVVLVRPRYWVRCVAGWGRLERIEAADGTRRETFLSSNPEPGLRLHVLLRAHDPKRSEKVIIHLDEKTVAFPGARQVYTCSKCQRFSSQYQNVVVEEHDRAAHEGISPAFSIVTPPLRQHAPLEFQASQPSRLWE
ncbi:MAG: hypothetical protein N2556_01955 [Anaerolineae bacterium]|nr:hypothetical protein [Anaerolineae bacterium]